MRLSISEEHAAFSASVRAVLAGREPRVEPPLGTWWDDRDAALADALERVGWSAGLDDPEMRGALVAGALELGRAVAPSALVDLASLGKPLSVEGRARHAEGVAAVAVVTREGLRVARVVSAHREPSLDGAGVVRVELEHGEPDPSGDRRLAAWSAATLGYLAGLAAASLDKTVEHVRSREQFGGPLAALPTMQALLADAALRVEGLSLVAWGAAAHDRLVPGELLWAGMAAREVTATAHQAHGGVGFALESGVHRAYRRAKSVQVWAAAVARASLAA